MVNLNARLVKELPEGLSLAQRGLYYGDALFESIRVFGGRIPLLERHWDRLSQGMGLMGYRIPTLWSADFFRREILRVAPPDARVRLTVWRAPGGLYLPENDDPQFLITAAGLETGVFEWPSAGIQVGLCGSVRLPVDALSGLKTLNAARYVAAAKYAQERGWDDAILLNAYERVCEATSSNVFWFEDEKLCTPPLSDGCVTGVMRDLLLTLTRETGLETAEIPASFDRLMAAEEVFLSNAVRGIRPVHSCEGKVFAQAQTRRLFELMVGYFR
jgi:branched-chain amino acid aminotransferase